MRTDEAVGLLSAMHWASQHSAEGGLSHETPEIVEEFHTNRMFILTNKLYINLTLHF